MKEDIVSKLKQVLEVCTDNGITPKSITEITALILAIKGTGSVSKVNSGCKGCK